MPLSLSLIALCVLVTLAAHTIAPTGAFALDPRDLAGHDWRALIAGAILSPFAHAGGWHLAANSIWILYFGNMLERSMSSRAYGLLIVAAIIISELAILAISPDPVLGASGITMALFGYTVARAHDRRDPELGAGILMGVIFIFFGGANVSWIAHLGGAIAGVSAYYMMNKTSLKRFV